MALALKAGLDPVAENAEHPRIDEIPFESEHRFMATLHHDHSGHAFVLLKGAPERVLGLCAQDAAGRPMDPEVWGEGILEAARSGQRVLALARREVPAGTTALDIDDIQPGFTLLGLAGMIDPPRPEAIAAVAECRTAGIRVKMITGDHAETAAVIGRELGLSGEKALTGDVVERLSDAELSSTTSRNRWSSSCRPTGRRPASSWSRCSPAWPCRSPPARSSGSTW